MQKKARLNLAFFTAMKSRSFFFYLNDVFWLIKKRNQSHWSVITITETTLKDAKVSTVTCCKTRSHFIKELDYDFTVTQAIKSKATICQTRLFAQGDNRLNYATEFLGFRQGRLDRFMAKQ